MVWKTMFVLSSYRSLVSIYWNTISSISEHHSMKRAMQSRILLRCVKCHIKLTLLMLLLFCVWPISSFAFAVFWSEKFDWIETLNSCGFHSVRFLFYWFDSNVIFSLSSEMTFLDGAAWKNQFFELSFPVLKWATIELFEPKLSHLINCRCRDTLISF